MQSWLPARLPEEFEVTWVVASALIEFVGHCAAATRGSHAEQWSANRRTVTNRIAVTSNGPEHALGPLDGQAWSDAGKGSVCAETEPLRGRRHCLRSTRPRALTPRDGAPLPPGETPRRSPRR